MSGQERRGIYLGCSGMAGGGQRATKNGAAAAFKQ